MLALTVCNRAQGVFGDRKLITTPPSPRPPTFLPRFASAHAYGETVVCATVVQSPFGVPLSQ